MACDQVLTPSGVITYASIQNYFTANPTAKLCFASGNFAPSTQGGSNIVLNGGSLIGSIDKVTGAPATRFYSLASYVTLNLQAGKYANFDFMPATSGALGMSLVKNIGNNANILSTNNIYRLNQYHSIGYLSTMTSATVDFFSDLFYMDGAATSAAGIDIENCNPCGTFYVTDTNFLVNTAAGAGDSVKGMYLFKSNAILKYLNLRNLDFQMTLVS